MFLNGKSLGIKTTLDCIEIEQAAAQNANVELDKYKVLAQHKDIKSSFAFLPLNIKLCSKKPNNSDAYFSSFVTIFISRELSLAYFAINLAC